LGVLGQQALDFTDGGSLCILQLENFTVAFKAAESVGIPSILVSGCSQQMFSTLTSMWIWQR